MTSSGDSWIPCDPLKVIRLSQASGTARTSCDAGAPLVSVRVALQTSPAPPASVSVLPVTAGTARTELTPANAA